MTEDYFIHRFNLIVYFLILRSTKPPIINKMPTIFIAVKDSLNIKNDAVKINMYTSAVVSGII
jgi:hypothetical protein